MLSQADEADIQAICEGSWEARANVIERHMALVKHIAKDFQNRGMSLEDLEGEGYLGLIKAVEAYSAKFQTNFSTYAGYWIRHSIRSAIAKAQPCRMPIYMWRLLSKAREAERALGGQPSIDEICDKMELMYGLKMPKKQRALLLKAREALQSVSTNWAENTEPEYVWDEYNHVERYMDTEEGALILKRLSLLNEREHVAIRMRFGLDGRGERTLKQIGKELQITREYVRVTINKALKKIREG